MASPFSPNRSMASHAVAISCAFHFFVQVRGVFRLGFHRYLRFALATAPDAEQDIGNHEFSWALMPHQGHFLESDVPMAAYLFNSPLHGIFILYPHIITASHKYCIVRYVPDNMLNSPLMQAHPLFTIDGARNIFLETIKRGEDDKFGLASDSAPTVVLRLYEAFGGHSKVQLKIARHFPVVKASITNLLEDETEELQILHAEDAEDKLTSVSLTFHGFEVKTVKLTLGSFVGLRDEQ